MGWTELIATLSFVAVSLLVFLISTAIHVHGSRLEDRLLDLAGKKRQQFTLHQLVAAIHALIPRLFSRLSINTQEKQTELYLQFQHAGIYAPQAVVTYTAVRIGLTTFPWIVTLTVYLLELTSLSHAVLGGACSSFVGYLAPPYWLALQIKQRKRFLQRTLPDMLDVLVISLQGGLGIEAAFQRVSKEFSTLYPSFGIELNIVQWEIQLGHSLSEAFDHFAERTDLDEIRTLASLFKQNERYGTGLLKSLMPHSELLRFKHVQYIEEMAQRAATKILFPTLLFIFPGIFVIILGPAVMQIRELMAKMQ